MVNIRRFRKFNTRDVHPGGRHDNDMCMTVRAGNRIFLRGQTGFDLDQKMRDPADAAAQAGQAMENARALLEEAGSSLSPIPAARRSGIPRESPIRKPLSAFDDGHSAHRRTEDPA